MSWNRFQSPIDPVYSCIQSVVRSRLNYSKHLSDLYKPNMDTEAQNWAKAKIGLCWKPPPENKIGTEEQEAKMARRSKKAREIRLVAQAHREAEDRLRRVNRQRQLRCWRWLLTIRRSNYL
jgi:hypothetical protein